jgi:hypothetical protein
MSENLGSYEQIFVIPSIRWNSIARQVFPEMIFESYSSTFITEFDSNWSVFLNWWRWD